LGLAEETEPDVVEVLVDMYESLGNQVALQYGGSELANTIKTYTKHSIASQSRDLLNAIKRYYSNSFTDAEKQHSINLFLGHFVPWKHNIALWDLETDYYLHNQATRPEHLLLSNSNWWDDPLREFDDANTAKPEVFAPPSADNHEMFFEEVCLSHPSFSLLMTSSSIRCTSHIN
jgi:hypothetical protein